MTMLSLAHIEETYIQQNTPIQSDTLISLNYPKAITGLSVSGTAILNHSSNSLVRITLQDDYNTEWLVYELFPLLTDSNVVTFDNVAFETSVLDHVTAKWLKVKIINATLQLTDINTSNQAVASYSLQQSRAMEAQSSYIIDKLNENLGKRNIPWRAGETSISQMTYEEKKAMFGGEVPNLGGFEYYKGGIFVMPDYEGQNGNEKMATASVSEEEDLYVKEWDWRNRHGKNWMTPVKEQGECGSCWAFATVGALEAYVNLYYNQPLNIDLSEQELVSCTFKTKKGCNGGHPSNALKYVKDNGLMDEESFPYTEIDDNCEDKPDISTERIKISNYMYVFPNQRKTCLYRSPLVVSLYEAKHTITLAGYKMVQAGEQYISEDLFSTIIIEEGNPLIGSTAWILKNSWGDNWGDNGFAYVITNDLSDTYYVMDSIVSLNYDDSNIIIEDMDGDGYYTWGLREKPVFLASWIPDTPDGDDSNPDYGPINQYGHLQEITLGESIKITTDEHWNEDNYLYNNIIIGNGGSLTISSDIILYKDAYIFVESGGELIIDNGSIKQANIRLKSGANMNIRNNGTVILGSADNFVTETGATLNIYSGGIELLQ